MQLGRVQIHLLSDGLIRLDGGGVFGLVPRVLWQSILAPDEDNRVSLNLCCLLICSGEKNILVDTGLGDKLSDKERKNFVIERPAGGLVEALKRVGMTPESIDVVINTHLHADHCGGNTQLVDGKVVPAFPNAEYWVQQGEWADAVSPNERTRATYLPQNFMPLQESGQLRLLEAGTHVTPQVQTVITRGHTQAHQSVIIESERKIALFTGDMATLAAHFERLGWVTAYDVEPLQTIETKRHWQSWALEHDALIIPAHDTQMPMGRLQEVEGKLHLEAVNSAPTQRQKA